MAHIQHIEELIREYLLFKGFGITLKTFDNELKADKEKSFRVDKILEQLMYFINSYDLNSLRELWNHLDSHIFKKLESSFQSGVRKLENAVLKLYLINAVVNSKPDKLMDFFLKLTPELQGQNEWREWFVLPYMRNPEDNPTFSLHFTRQWQDTLWVSLHNFLASVFQHMPTPALLRFEEDANRISKLEQRNESLTKKIALLIDKTETNASTPCQIGPPADLMDDFYCIAQESNIIDSQGKSLKNLIRSMGSGTSPILGRKDNGTKKKNVSTTSKKTEF